MGLGAEYQPARRGRSHISPMFSHISTEDRRPFGSFKWSTDFGGDVTDLKVYPGFVHILKGRMSAGSVTMPRTVKQARLRLSTLKRWEDFLKVHNNQHNALLPISSSLRVEVSLVLRQSVEATKDRALKFAEDFMPRLQFRALPFSRVVINLGEWLNTARLYPVGRGRDAGQLPLDGRTVMAVILNQAGVANSRVVERVDLPRPGLGYLFSRSRIQRPTMRRARGIIRT